MIACLRLYTTYTAHDSGGPLADDAVSFEKRPFMVANFSNKVMGVALTVHAHRSHS